MKLVFVFLAVTVGCQTSAIDPRITYNDALGLVRTKKYDEAEKKLLEARQSSSGDRDLQIAAAWQLGELHSTQGQTKYAEQDLQGALSHYQTSRSWFDDAISLAPENQDLRKNWEVIGRKIQIISDELNKDGGLRKKIEQAIEEQRTIRDGVRGFLAQGTTIDTFSTPVRNAFTVWAQKQRIAQASVGSLTDLAQNELDGLNNLAENERKPEQANRIIQLGNLMQYLHQARQFQSSARKQLQDIQSEQLTRSTHHAVENLKRAREQLLSPPEVLQELIREQNRINTQTSQVTSAKKISTDSAPPAWMNYEDLGDRQDLLAQRTQEVLLRLKGAVEHGLSEPPPGEEQGNQEEMKFALKAAEAAVPFVEEAFTAQNSATVKLTGAKNPEREQETALENLAQALELFSDLRQTLELTYQEHNRSIAFLKNEHPEVKKIPAREKSDTVRKALTANTLRLERLKSLIQLENKPPDGQEESEEDAQKRIQLYARAEELRAQAAQAHQEFSRTKKLTQAEDALRDLEELRKLFFTLLEHLKQLTADQIDTRDQTSEVQDASTPEDERRVLGPLAPLQTEHQLMADEIVKALEEHAASQEKNEAKRFQDAAAEVSEASTAMLSAQQFIADGVSPQRTTSLDKTELLHQQELAIGHLQEALRILEPPQNQENQDDSQNQKNQPQPSQDQQMSEAEAQRRKQAIRDQQEKRSKEKKNQQTSRAPIKDW